MAEVIGALASAVTLAALFKTCVEAFDLIQASRKQEEDFKKLELRLHIEKCRLYTWGQAIGLTDPNSDKTQLIDSLPFAGLIRKSLDFILEMFDDANKIRDRYGCKECPSQQGIETESFDAMRHLTASFAGFRISKRRGDSSTTALQKARWLIHDRKKFVGFISEVKELIDGLKDITSSVSSIAGQERMIRQRIARITNVQTLEMISEICEVDHPRLSNAASVRADALSMPTSKRVDIEHWSGNIDEVTVLDVVGDVEGLSVTELKHLCIRFYQESQLLRAEVERLENSNNAYMRREPVQPSKRSWPQDSHPHSPISSKRISLAPPFSLPLLGVPRTIPPQTAPDTDDLSKDGFYEGEQVEDDLAYHNMEKGETTDDALDDSEWKEDEVAEDKLDELVEKGARQLRETQASLHPNQLAHSEVNSIALSALADAAEFISSRPRFGYPKLPGAA
jgi:Prion-inhibition and propagation